MSAIAGQWVARSSGACRQVLGLRRGLLAGRSGQVVLQRGGAERPAAPSSTLHAFRPAIGVRVMATAGSAPAAVEDPLVQYILIRADLWTGLGWNLGSVMAQGCHAAVAAVWESRHSPHTQQYCAPEALDGMRKASRWPSRFLRPHAAGRLTGGKGLGPWPAKPLAAGNRRRRPAPAVAGRGDPAERSQPPPQNPAAL